MKLKDLAFDYPESLIALDRASTSRVMVWRETQVGTASASGSARSDASSAGEASSARSDASDPALTELPSVDQLIEFFTPGDVLVINDTQVLKRRIFGPDQMEILFIQELAANEWSVLCPARKWPKGQAVELPGGIRAELVETGRPQKLRVSQVLTPAYFAEYGELPLPPYIQKARGERHNRGQDDLSYQTAWAEKPGSLAAPTASLHFTDDHLRLLKKRGVEIQKITLHVGLGTFLPVTVENLDEHEMHSEWVSVPQELLKTIAAAKLSGNRVWALGTTVTRALESVAIGLLKLSTDSDGRRAYRGETKLFIRPGFEYKVVDNLLTNFHQPESTLLALVAAFAGLENVQRAYAWAIERKFRLFSYGDLTVWIKAKKTAAPESGRREPAVKPTDKPEEQSRGKNE